MNKTKILIIITILLLLAATIFVSTSRADDTINITKSMGNYQYFMDYNRGWTTLGTPFYSTNGMVTYCLEHKEPSPKVNTEYSGSTTPFDYFTSRTLRGLQIILKNGYPNVIPDGLNADQARYATANALRFWLSEEDMPRQYNYTNLSSVNVNLLAQNGYVSGCRVKANTSAPGSVATLSFAIDLLKMARAQERLQYNVTFTPENLSLSRQGEYYVGQTTVSLEGLTGMYDLDESELPSNTTIDGYTGNDGDVLTISIPASSINQNTRINLVGKATNQDPYGHAFWASPNASVQKMVYLGVEFEPIGDGVLSLDIAGGWGQIIKTDEDDGERLAGAVFELYDSEDNFIEELTTDGQGKATTSFLEPGDYYFVETQQPYKYMLDNIPNHFTITGNSTQREVVSVEITNAIIKGQIRVLKMDTLGNPLEGAQFEIVETSAMFEPIDGIDEGFLVGMSEEQVEILTTDSSGSALSSMLDMGTYYIREITPPEGFLLDPTPQYFEIRTYGEVLQFSMVNDVNTEYGYVVVKKYDDQTGEPLSNACFSVIDDRGITMDYIITDVNGTARSYGLPLGSYTLVESYPPHGYITNETTEEPIPFEITEVGQVVLIDNLTNTQIYGGVLIRKIDTEDDMPIAGAVFGIYEFATDELVAEITTDENGIATYDHLEYTTEVFMGFDSGYYYKEIVAPAGYSIDSLYWNRWDDEPLTDQDIKEDNRFIITEFEPFPEFVVVNERDDYSIRILKADEYGIPLEGAEFEIYDMDDNLLDTIITDENGLAVTVELNYDEYYIIETVAPIDYILDSSPIYFSWQGGANNTITVVNELAEGAKIHITKTDEDGLLLENVDFNLYDSNDNLITTLTTDSRGEVTSTLLSYGDYYLVETTTLEGYDLDSTPIPITVDDSSFIYEVSVINYKEDTTQYGNIRIFKRDVETLEPLANAEFILMLSDRTEVARLTTDETGNARLYDIPFGTYYIQEVTAPEGYNLNISIYTAEIDEERTFTFNLTNSPIKAPIQITKVDSLDNTIVLSGVEFEVHNSDGELIETIVTDENGIATTSELRFGEHTFTEVKTIDGYILNSIPFTVVILPDGTVTANTVIPNSPTQLDIYKVKYEDNTPLSGAGFKVKNSLGLKTYTFTKNADGTYRYNADGEIQEILVDENGKATIYGLPFGNYWLEESTVPADYYPCAPTKVVIESFHSIDTPLEVSILNSKFVNLGLDKDRWHLPVAISLVSLLTFTIILLIIFRKTRGDRNEH